MKEQKKEYTGTWIPAVIMEDKDLKPVDKLLFAEIASFNVCWKKSSELAERVGVGQKAFQSSCRRLKEKKYITEKRVFGRIHRQAFTTAKNTSKPKTHQSQKGVDKQSQNTPDEQSQKGVVLLDNTIENNKDNTLSKIKNFAGKKEPDKINILIDMFKIVNPSWERLFANKTQRACLERLVTKYTYKKVAGMIQSLPVSNSEKYAPTVTTPLQLESKLGQLIAYWNKKLKNNIIAKV